MFECSNKSVAIEGVAKFFTEVDNLFNDPIPQKEFVDLRKVINKYSLLVPEVVTPLLVKWKNAIEKVNTYLRTIEEKINEDTSFINKVRKMFSIPNQETTVILELNHDSFEPNGIDFTFPCGSEDIDKVEKIRNFLFSFYKPIEFRNENEYFLFKDSSISMELDKRILLENWIYHSNSPKRSSQLLYSGSKNGFSATTFHNLCNKKPHTLTLIKANGYIFGGYTYMWSSSGGYKCDTQTYIFSLTNPSNKSILFKNIKPQYSIDDSPNYGPTFGGGNDIYISDNCGSNNNSHSNLGHSFSGCPFKSDTVEAKSFLCGSHKFKVEEIEVWQLL